MERFKLREARGSRSLKEIADAIGCSVDSLENWERGATNPQWHWRNKLCSFYGKEPFDLDFSVNPQTREGEIAMLQQKLEGLNLDRREILEFIGTLSVFAGFDLSALSGNFVAPEEFLSQCHAAIKACWHLLRHDGLIHVNDILKECLPTLTNLATHRSDVQGMAASLAVEAKTLEGLLAKHRLDYTGLEIHIAGATRFARLSGNNRLLASCLSWQGANCPNPKRAISICNEGLKLLGRDAYLDRAELSIGLAHAYALDNKQDQALEMVRQARSSMPLHPEKDPLYHLIDFGLSDLDRVEGRTYLALVEHFPKSDYAEKAYNAFAQGIGKQATSSRSQSQTLIHQADAAILLDNMPTFLTCLEQGIDIALRINSEKRKDEASIVLSKAPDAWQKETKYQDLVKMF